MVSTSMFMALTFELLLSVVLPIVLIFVFRKKFAIPFNVLLIGIITFFLFVIIFENITHYYFLAKNKTTIEWLSNPWLYMLYGALMAGFFEETGRLIMMKYAMKNCRQWRDGLSFGLGHGGCEAIMLVGMASVSSLILAVMINTGSFDALLSTDSSLQFVKNQLTGSSAMVWLSGLERLCALVIQLGLSILVLYGVAQGKWRFYFLAIAGHALMDFPTALYQIGKIDSLFLVESIMMIFAILSLIWIVKSRNLFQSKAASPVQSE